LTLVSLYPDFETYSGLSIEEQSWLIAKEYGICNGWRVNFAVDQNGASFGASGSSSDVSTVLDRVLMGRLRSQADVIVTSGKTARAEKYKSSKHAPIAIFTTCGDLDVVPAIQGTQYFTPLVLTPTSSLESVQQALSDVDVRILGFESDIDVESWPLAVAQLIQREGFQSPILESGRTTIRSFIKSGIVEELCITISSDGKTGVSARDLSASKLSASIGDMMGFELAQLFTDGRTIYSRWVHSGVAATGMTA
jgi:riboflavin biosynthesis pyrimidine reductase